MSLLDDCIIFAVRKHSGQLDKDGKPHVFHAFRVMLNPRMDTEHKKIASVDHDVFEDTSTEFSELVELGVPAEIIYTLDCLTHRPNESNDTYHTRILTDPTGVAREVKLADIEDNLSPNRIGVLPPKDQERMRKKYSRARRILMGGSISPVQDYLEGIIPGSVPENEEEAIKMLIESHTRQRETISEYSSQPPKRSLRDRMKLYWAGL